jgi:hypothetical protein
MILKNQFLIECQKTGVNFMGYQHKPGIANTYRDGKGVFRTEKSPWYYDGAGTLRFGDQPFRDATGTLRFGNDSYIDGTGTRRSQK